MEDTRLRPEFEVDYLGYTSLDRRCTNPMLPWVVAEIQVRGLREKVKLRLTEGRLIAMECVSQATLFEHRLTQISRFSYTQSDRRCFMYFVRDSKDTSYLCYLYQAYDPGAVVDLFTSMRDHLKEGPPPCPPPPAPKSVSGLPNAGAATESAAVQLPLSLASLGNEVMIGSSQFFEVLYVGKIKVPCKKVPHSFVDEALERFIAHEAEKKKRLQQQQQQQKQVPQQQQQQQPEKKDNQQSDRIESSDHLNGGAVLLTQAVQLDSSRPNSNGPNSAGANLDTANPDAASSNGSSSNVSAPPKLSCQGSQEWMCTSDLGSTESISTNPPLAILVQSNASKAANSGSGDNGNSGANSAETGLLRSASMDNKMVEQWKKTQSPGSSFSAVKGMGPLGDATSCLTKSLSLPPETMRMRASSTGSEFRAKLEQAALARARSSSNEHNRTMLLLVGKCDLHLVSPDRKSVLLHKTFWDVSQCTQATVSTHHFGLICREGAAAAADQTTGHVGYIFRCESASVCEEVMVCLKSSIQCAIESQRRRDQSVSTCDHCPMVWFHRLCSDLEQVSWDTSDAGHLRSHSLLMRRMQDGLPQEQMDLLMDKYRGAEEAPTVQERNQLLVMLIRAHCESKQLHHVHDTAENRHEFLSQYLTNNNNNGNNQQQSGPATIFNKAKRSLTTSFDNLMKRKGSPSPQPPGGHFGSNPSPLTKEMSLPINAQLFTVKEPPVERIRERRKSCKDSPSPPRFLPEEGSVSRPRSSTVASAKGDLIRKELAARRAANSGGGANSANSANSSASGANSGVKGRGSPQRRASPVPAHPTIHEQSFHTPRNSPMMNMFLKVGQHRSCDANGLHDATTPHGRNGSSWRQAIFQRVVTPTSRTDQSQAGKTPVLLPGTPVVLGGDSEHGSERSGSTPHHRSREELRSLWRKAAVQQILLSRMEKENSRLRARQEEASVKRLKLVYEDLCPCGREELKCWDDLLQRKEGEVNAAELMAAVVAGVPRQRRGQVWQLLTRAHQLNAPASRAASLERDFPGYSHPYEQHLLRLTSHQHAILIDLGRTFPQHPYFSSPLGMGQLALFNILKAYSLLDPQVGYCQGLSFVAGAILLHLPEEDAFHAFKFLMVDLGLRGRYLPDMEALQVEMYQTQRLVHDHLDGLHRHLESHEVSPALYLAPWLLTLFASSFPLGVVTRLMDMTFLLGLRCLPPFCLLLLGEHRDMLLQCSTFEAAVSYLKADVTKVTAPMLSRLVARAAGMRAEKELDAYEVEYHVLQEEHQSGGKAMARLESEVESLRRRNMELERSLEKAVEVEYHVLQEEHQNGGKAVARLESEVESLRRRNLDLEHSLEKALEEGGRWSQMASELRERVDALESQWGRRRSGSLSRESSLDGGGPGADSDDSDVVGLVHAPQRNRTILHHQN